MLGWPKSLLGFSLSCYIKTQIDGIQSKGSQRKHMYTHTPIELWNWGLWLYWSVQQHGTLQDRHQELPNGDFPYLPGG